MKAVTNPVAHELVDVALRVTRLRDRLRCPVCDAVGTWKPHGGLFDRSDARRTRRWLCKWCGHYAGPEPQHQAWLIPGQGWRYPFVGLEGLLDGTTPQRELRERLPGVWPWRG